MSIVERVDIFPTIIGKFDEFLFQEQCDAIIDALRSARTEEYGALTGNGRTTFRSTHNLSELLPPDLSTLLYIKIQTAIDQYCVITGIQKQVISNCWVSYQYPGSTLKEHTHAGSHVSGVIYLKADELSSPIYFTNPNPFLNFTSLDTDLNNETFYKKYKFTPKTGTAILFPSWLEHGSGGEENQSEERIILSFNSTLAGSWKLGQKT